MLRRDGARDPRSARESHVPRACRDSTRNGRFCRRCRHRCLWARPCVWSSATKSARRCRALHIRGRSPGRRERCRVRRSPGINSKRRTRVENSDSMISIGRDLGVGLIDVGAGHAVLAAAAARAAAENFILHIALAGFVAAPADDDRAAAAAVADFFMRRDLTRGFEQGFTSACTVGL